MENILLRPWANEKYAEFAISANQTGKRIEITDEAAYALLDFEIIQDDKIVDISDTEEYKTKKTQEARRLRTAEIKAELALIDEKTIRPLRAGEAERLEELEEEAEKLRAELAELEERE